MTKVDLITGILGSGKTTFIRKYARYLCSKGLKTAVLLNDFGAVNIDMMMLSDIKSENCKVEMIVGGADADCHKRRFKTQLISLGMQHFDRIIIEPSGIFDMDEFFDTLHESPLDIWFETGSVITIADAGLEDILSDEMEFLLGSQSACSGKIVLSKASEEDCENASEKILSHINRSLEFISCRRRFKTDDIISVPWEKYDDAVFSKVMNAGYRNEGYVKLYNRDTISSKAHYFMNIKMDESIIESVLNDIMYDKKCGKVFRIKGALQKSSGKWLQINAMPGNFTITESDHGQSVIIVIGDELNISEIDSHLKSVNTDSEYISI